MAEDLAGRGVGSDGVRRRAGLHGADGRVAAPTVVAAPARPAGRGDGVRLAPLLLAGLAVRLALAPVGAFAFDLDLVRRWATRLAQEPPWRFYDVDGLTVDHLPGDLWLLLGISRAYHALAATPDVDGRLFLTLLKLPPALADVGIGALLFLLGRRLAGERAGFAAAAVWLFNPAPIFVGAIWGQWDALSAGLAVLALWLLVRGSTGGALPTLAYAALIKPPLVLLAPLGALWFVRRWGVPWRAGGAGAAGRRAWGGVAVGVAAAWLFAVWPWAVHQARWAIIPATVPPLLALTLLLLVRALRRGSDRGIVAAALAAGLTVAGYHAMELYVPLLGLGALAVYRGEVGSLRREAVAYAAALFAILAGPVLYLSTVDPGGRTRFDQTSLFGRGEVGPWELARQYLAYVSPRFLFVAGDGDPMHSPPGAGLVPWVAAPFLVGGLVWLGATAVRGEGWTRRSARFLLVALALAPVPGALTVPSPHTLRAAHFSPLLALVTAVGVVAAADRVGAALRRVGRASLRTGPSIGLPLLALVVAGAELGGRYRDYFGPYPARVAAAFNDGLAEALAYADEEGANADEVWDEVWVEAFEQPYIFVLFHHAWSPSEVHTGLAVRRDPPAFNRVDAFDRYRFGTPAGIDIDGLPLLRAIAGVDGRTAYEVRGGEVAGRGRVMVLRRGNA